MVVQHNLTAMNSNRMLGLTGSAQAKSTEKLSSGYKINRAADDAAGLSISEKMRKQIRGLTQASANAQDGISAVQTAEGALNEVQDMLQRMNELAVKAANGTNSLDDREYIQNEIDQLVTEINRVAETTKFNETYLLKGDMKNTQQTIGYVGGEATEASITANVPLYAAGGTQALSEAEILEALKKGEKLYTNPVAAPQTEANSYSYTAGSVTWTGTLYAADSTSDSSFTQITQANWADYFDFDEDTGKLTAKENVVFSSNGADNVTSPIQGVTWTPGTSEGTYATIVKADYGEGAGVGVTAALYAEGGITALTEAEAKEAIKNGDTLYTDPANPQIEAVADTDYVYTPASGGPNVVFGEGVTTLYDEDGNAVTEEQAADILREGGKLYTDTGAAAQTAAGASYKAATASVVAGQTLYSDSAASNVIDDTNWSDYFDVADDGTVTLKAGVTVYTAASTAADFDGTDDITDYITGVAEEYTGVTGATLYAEGSKVALTEAEAKAALKNGDTLYTDPASPTEAKEGIDYTLSNLALYDAHGNKISENGLDSYIEILEDGTFKMKDGKELYTDEKGKSLFDPTDAEAAAKYLQVNATTAALDLSLHVGADATRNNQIEMKIEAMSAKAIGVDGLKVNGSDSTNALDAIETIKAAIQKISTQRSALGAIQNRLEHTINNLDNVVENTTAAESRIRDTDMATEMVKYANNNILAQAGQAMLAQANQANQGVLSLLG